MKKNLLSLLTVFFVTVNVFGQQWSSQNEPPALYSVNHAARMAAEILDAAGLESNFKIAEARVPNAMAVVHQGSRYVLYNEDFIERLTRVTGTRWAAVSVLAHEIGHHLYPTQSGRLLATELEADQFSGYVLQKMGASLEDAQAAMKVLGTTRATATHPAVAERLSYIAKGWKLAGGKINTEEDEEIYAREETARSGSRVAVRSTTNRNTTNRRESVLPERYIVGKLNFNSDRDNEYYVTTSLNVVKFDGANLTVIGKVAKSNSRDYPYIIYDGSGYRLYIERGGGIVNSRGTQLGTITVTS